MIDFNFIIQSNSVLSSCCALQLHSFNRYYHVVTVVLVDLRKSIPFLVEHLKHKRRHESSDVDHLEAVVARVVESLLRRSPDLRRRL